MGTQFSAPWAGSPITTSQQYRDRYRPTQPDMIDDSIGGTALQVSNSGNTAVAVNLGSAIIQGAYYNLSGSSEILPVNANGGGSNRFDIVVLTYDAGFNPPCRVRIVQGTPGAGLPAINRSFTGYWDMPLAHFEKQPGGNIVNIVDRRHFSDGTGGIVGMDVTWAPFAPNRTGARFLEWASTKTYYWTGSQWQHTNTLGNWNSYTPTWTSTGTAPSLGNGSLTGRFCVLDNKTIAFQAHLVTGGTSTYGSGNYRLSTPPGFNAVTTYEQFVNGKAYDASANLAYMGQGNLGTAGVSLMQFTNGGALQSANATQPFTWASGDHLRVHGIYEYA